MTISAKELSEKHTTSKEVVNACFTCIDDYYHCNLPNCKNSFVKGDGSNTNLLQHLNTKKHRDEWYKKVCEFRIKNGGAMDKFANIQASDKAISIHNWLDYGVNNNEPLNFVENEYIRKYTRLDPISRNTYVKYLDGLSLVMEEKLKEMVSKVHPKRFGVIFDGNYMDYFFTFLNL